MLSKMLMQTIPTKKISIDILFFSEILPNLKKKYPINALNNAHNTLMSGEESPCQGGLAKGVGKGFPEIPFTKCGTALARNIPAKKVAM